MTATTPTHHSDAMNPKPASDIVAFLPSYMRIGEPEKRNYKPERYELGYITEGLDESVTTAHREVQWWLNDILHGATDRRRWLTLYGKSGCGKTHLAVYAIAVLKANGKQAQKWGWSKLKGRLLDGSCPGLWDQVVGMPYLAIDDIGADFMSSERAAGVSASLLYDLLEVRLGKWTLITSNLTPAELPDMRIASRLKRGQNVLVDMTTARDFSNL